MTPAAATPTAAMIAPDGLTVEVIILDTAAVYRVTEPGRTGRYLVGRGYYHTPAEVMAAVGEARYAALTPGRPGPGRHPFPPGVDVVYTGRAGRGATPGRGGATE